VSKTIRNKKTTATPATTDAGGEATNTGTPEATKPVIKQAYYLVKSGKAFKIGKRSQGAVSYRLLSDIERQTLHLNITANDGGGYFSREILPLAKVKDCLTSAVTDKPFSSKLFGDAFVGRSANNAGFLTAILYGEGLLLRAPNTHSLYVLGEDWDGWVAAMLVNDGELIEVELPMPKKSDNNDASEAAGSNDENPS
jgi:hypothetical protein